MAAKKRGLLPPVIFDNCRCARGCSKTVSEDDRKDANNFYWNLGANAQVGYIRETVKCGYIKQRAIQKHGESGPRKKNAYEYYLRTTLVIREKICRNFYLNTLGYTKHSGNMLYRLVDGDTLNLVVGNIQEILRNVTRLERISLRMGIRGIMDTFSKYSF